MIAFRLTELVPELDAQLIGADARIASVATDSRSLAPGALFVALRGARVDGHDFLATATAQGAVAALVDTPQAPALPQLVVPDVRVALGRLAALWRAQSPARRVAVTGSNGKTSVKEMIAAILARRGSVLATRGNLNNDIGLPLTLTRLQDEAFAVLELGANHSGEIRALSAMARPEVAVITNAGRAHLEGFGSLEGVARAKGEIVAGLVPGGALVLNADDAFAPLWRELAGAHPLLEFGIHAPAQVSSPVDAMRLVWDAPDCERGFEQRFELHCTLGAIEIGLRLIGEHNRLNALAASAAAMALGASLEDVRDGLAQVAPVPGRLCPVPTASGMRLIDDSYNGNPDSVTTAIAVLAAAPGQRHLVLGDLAELGPSAPELHRELGARAAAAGVERLWACGPLGRETVAGFGAGACHFATRAALIEALGAHCAAEDTVLIKGSRSARMETVVQALAAGAVA